MNILRLHVSDEAFHAVAQIAAGLARRGEDRGELLKVPALICAPSVACLNWLKRELLAHGRPLLNIHFLTPPLLRQWLLARFGAASVEVAEPQDLECLAKTFLRQHQSSSLVSSARLLVEAIQRKMQSGPGARLEQQRWERLSEQFAQSCQNAGLFPAPAVDAILARRFQENQKFIGRYDLFLYGFNARHWSIWRLLATAAQAARQADVYLSYPRVVAEKPGFWWMGSWEEIGIMQSDSEAANRYQEFTDDQEMRQMEQIVRDMDQGVSSTQATGRVVFHVASDGMEEARVIAAQIVQWLPVAPDRVRVGVVLSNHPALAAEVASVLEALGIPVRHEYGVPEAVAPWQRLLGLWVDLWSRQARADEVSRLFREYGDRLADFFGETPESPEIIDSFLGTSLAALLSDRLMVYASDRGLLEVMPPPLKAFSHAWAGQFALPETMGIEELREKIDKVIGLWTTLESSENWAKLQRQAHQWLDRVTRSGLTQMAREEVCDWFAKKALPDLEKVTGSVSSVVTVTTPERAEAQAWDYLFLGGLNEGFWPGAPEPHPLVHDALCEQWNHQAMTISRHGQGVECFAPGHSAVLTSQARRMLDREQFLNLIASVRTQVAASCCLFDRSKNNLPLSPSEFYQRLFSAAHGEILSEAVLHQIRSFSLSLLEKASPEIMLSKPCPDPQRYRFLREIYDCRRDPDRPFDEFSYAVGEPLKQKIIFSAKDWQELRQRPATLWYRHLRLKPRPTFSDIISVLSLHRGTLIHEWIGQALLAHSDDMGAGLLRHWRGDQMSDQALLKSLSQRQRERFYQAYQGAGSRMPVQWREEISRLTWATGRILNGLAGLLSDMYFQTEFKKGSRSAPVTVRIGGVTLESYGKIDLLLADSADVGQARKVKVIDYKTSASRSTFDKAKNGELFRHGDYLQVALYALFHMLDSGSRELCWAIHNPYFGAGPDNEMPGDPAALEALLRPLEKTQKEGVFGQLEALDEEYGIPPELPTACLPVDKDILLARWQRTFNPENQQTGVNHDE